VLWKAALKKGTRVGDDPRVAGVQEDPQAVAAAGSHDMAIA
jgi:hypothetical protein